MIFIKVIKRLNNSYIKNEILFCETLNSFNQSTSNRFLSSNLELENIFSDSNLRKCIENSNGIILEQLKNNKKSNLNKKEIKKAAVLIPLCYNSENKPSILFTLRSPKLKTHKFEICFPGGKLDPEDDNDLCTTAVRETNEEIGINQNSIKVFGLLKPVPGRRSNSFIYPVLALIDLKNDGIYDDCFVKKSYDEVEEVIIRPIEELIKEENWKFTHWQNGFTTPVYKDKIFNDRNVPRIWGLTSFFLYTILNNLLPNHFNVKYPTLDRFCSKS